MNGVDSNRTTGLKGLNNMTKSKYDVYHVTPVTKIRLGFVLANNLREARERILARYGKSANRIEMPDNTFYHMH